MNLALCFLQYSAANPCTQPDAKGRAEYIRPDLAVRNRY